MYLSQFIPLSLALLSLNVLTASHPIPGPLTEVRLDFLSTVEKSL